MEVFFSKYSHKIKTLHEIIKLKINKKIILCHGHFDFVHPGHLRHLSYAKSKADILVVSLTPDKFITKGIYRPHVPENLRALNVAAYEMVDYVYIDTYPKPLNLLKKLKPDFFAKGFEYTSNGLNPATLEEMKIVKSYKGKMIFTPGDIIYSSSHLLDKHLPKIDYEKLMTLLYKNKISLDNIANLILNFKKLKIHILGDLIVDTLTKTSLIGGQIKTPTISVLYQDEKNFVGGAGVVAKHCSAAGANVTLTSILGEDKLKKFVINDLKKNKINFNCIIDNTRSTTNKNSIVSNNYRLLKIDKLDNQQIDDQIKNQIKNFIKKDKNAEAFIFSDFRHGIFNEVNIKYFSKTINKKSLKIADSQVASRWGNILEFNNFDLILPNEREARFSLADQDSSISNLARNLMKKSKCNYLILKLGQRGSVTVSKTLKKNIYDSFYLPSFVSKLIDPVGSGDAYLAYSTMGLLASKSILIASILGSLAAACECEEDGNIPITGKKIINKIEEIKKIGQVKIY